MKPKVGPLLVVGLFVLAACNLPTTGKGGKEATVNAGSGRGEVGVNGSTSKDASPAASTSPIPTIGGGTSKPGETPGPNATGSPGGAGASASPTASPTPAAGIAATPTPQTKGLAVPAPVAVEQPKAIVNFETGEIIWSPTEPVFKWKVKARTETTFAKVELYLGADAKLAYRLRQAESPSPSPTASPSETPSPDASGTPEAPPSLDTSFVPPSAEPTPVATPTPISGGKPELAVTKEIPIAAIGAPEKLKPGGEVELLFRLNSLVVEQYIREQRPSNVVYVDIVPLGPDGQALTDGEEPIKLSGQFLIK